MLLGTARALSEDDNHVNDVTAVLQDVNGAFARWAGAHGRPYLTNSAEMEKRRSIFHQNALFVQQHNDDESQRSRLALNQFADLTLEEFKASYLGYKPALAEGRDGGNAARLQVYARRACPPASLLAYFQD